MKFAPQTVALLLVASATTLAAASGPTLQFDLASPGGGTSWSALGTALGPPNTFGYSGLEAGSNWSISYNMTATDTAFQTKGILGGNVSVLNTAAFAQTFSLTIVLPTFAQGVSSMTGGSVSGVLTGDADGGTFTSVGSLPVWQAFTIPSGRNSPVTIASLMAGPYSVTATPFSVANLPGEAFGKPIPGMPFSAMGDGMGIRMDFILGAGDKVDFTTAFVMDAVIPTPGGLALLAAGALSMRSRRRR